LKGAIKLDKKQFTSWGVSFGSLALVAGMVSYLGLAKNTTFKSGGTTQSQATSQSIDQQSPSSGDNQNTFGDSSADNSGSATFGDDGSTNDGSSSLTTGDGSNANSGQSIFDSGGSQQNTGGGGFGQNGGFATTTGGS
jgi:hypothetical protein